MVVKWILFGLGILLLACVEIARVYFIMPFPGSQEDESVQLAYTLQNNMGYVRLIGWVLILYPVISFFRSGSQMTKVIAGTLLAFYGLVFYMFNFRFLADKMFLQPRTKSFLKADANKKVEGKQLVLGVAIGNESKAYPVEVIGYHHQVRDTVGGTSVMVTYCTVCRTGRVFSPMVDGKAESFRLVGMDHYNAMFEDASTKSWWRQVSGEAIAGPLKGKSLIEIPSQQMTLNQWISHHPNTYILQPDTVFSEAYKELADYDEGKRKGRLERKDSLSWMDKSWIVGVQIGMDAKAYDWIELEKDKAINDIVNDEPIVVVMHPDSASFYVFKRVVEPDTLMFNRTDQGLSDTKTNSLWDWSGHCVDGVMKGKSLVPVQAYQEYWHSWRTFRPQTKKFKG
ncbi:MAG: DUF3179 domain-containing protein [Cyclobacteriaceae bacterium]|nr:DUF3179 domain-containing protein [Cyclobacteriaceae bacterium]